MPALQLLLPISQGADLVDDFASVAAQQVGRFGQSALLVGHVIQRTLPRDRFDAAHARGHAAFADQLEQADVARAAHVGAATEFGGVVAHLQDAHLLAVLFAEQRHRSEIQGLLHAHVVDLGRTVGADLGVHPALDLGQFGLRHRLEVREVEAQAIRRHQRALLLDMRAQHLAQGRMQQVGGRVVEDGTGATRGIDGRHHVVADLQAALGDATDMAVELARELQRIGDIEFDALPASTPVSPTWPPDSA